MTKSLKETLHCYSINYSKDWLKYLDDRPAMVPFEGAILAIHNLIDIVKRQDKIISMYKKEQRK